MRKIIKVVAAGILFIAFLITIVAIPPITSNSQTPPNDSLSRDSLRNEMFSTLWQFKKANDSLENKLPEIQRATKIHSYNLIAFKKNVASMKDRLERYQRLLKEKEKEKEIVTMEIPVVEEKTFYIYKDEKGRVIGYDSAAPVPVKKSFWQKLFKR